MSFDLQISFTGRIVYAPDFYPADGNRPNCWKAVIEVVVAPVEDPRGGFRTQTRHIEIIQRGTSAIRAHNVYKQGDMVTGQGCDVDSRAYTTKDRHGNEVPRARTTILATALGQCTRYEAIPRGDTIWPPSASVSPRHAQGGRNVVHHPADDYEPATSAA